jgi:hypothetical protein
MPTRRFSSCRRLEAGYPAYVRGWVCMARDGSMQRGYRDVGYLFAMKLREFRPDWFSGRAWRYHLRTLWASLETCDDRAATWWFAATYPNLVALIPTRQQAHFMAGVREIACGE